MQQRTNMSTSTAIAGSGNHKEFLNAYQIVNVDSLLWDVGVYSFEPLSKLQQAHSERGKLTALIWELRRQYPSLCRGFGYAIDFTENKVAVPASWNIPDQDEFHGFKVTREQTTTVSAKNPADQPIVFGILRESIKNRFKEQVKLPSNTELGQLWQNYNDFCQLPPPSDSNGEAHYCRQFNASIKSLQGNILVLQFEVTTQSIDGWSFEDYYTRGEVDRLAIMINTKRANRQNRRNEPTKVRILCIKGTVAKVMELERPEDIFQHGELTPLDQQQLSTQMIYCKSYNGAIEQVPLKDIRLIIDSKIAGDSHSETIIDPDQRVMWIRSLRNFLDKMDCYGCPIELSKEEVSINEFGTLEILPPALMVRDSNGEIKTIEAPDAFTRNALRERCRTRDQAVTRNGFLYSRPVNLLLVTPEKFGKDRSLRMQRDLNWLLEKQGIRYQFDSPKSFKSVPEIHRLVQRGEYDAVFAVLPEGKREPYTSNDTHEQIKRQIQVASQCIHYDNTLPMQWVDKRPREFKDAQPQHARRIESQYRQCLLGLLVKNNWIPFSPADPFNYNVQVGIDVGGQHNTEVMVCIGYGFMNPQKHGLVFLLKHIQVNAQKAEPILVDPLYSGLLDLFDELKMLLDTAGLPADFNRTLFFRDGLFHGSGDEWNELDALKMLYNTALNQRGWIQDGALWTGVELSKRAEYWRVFRQENQSIRNPLIGKCIFPFDDPDCAIVCTTGSPYLTQGTASPLVARVVNIIGKANRNEVFQDLVWAADMCFTKLDMGMSLPWVLNVADAGALQIAKAYRTTGITV